MCVFTEVVLFSIIDF